MAEPARQTDDRLPWVTGAPQDAPPPPSPARKPRLPLLAVLLGAAFALIAIGAYWLGSRPGTGSASGEAETERPGMSAQVATLAEAEAQEQEQARENASRSGESDTGAPAVERQGAPSTTDARSSDPERSRVVEEASRQPIAPSRRKSLRRKSTGEGASELAPMSLQPVVRGRLIQTGAFPSREEAERAWAVMVRRWPYLATKPRLISPLEVRSTDGRATQMFRVQLATASQAQSVVICQRLVAAKQSCVVVY